MSGGWATPLGPHLIVHSMSKTLEDDVIAIEMDGKMRVRFADWTPSWAYDVLYERVLDSRSIDLPEISDGTRVGTACLDTEAEVLKWFNPR